MVPAALGRHSADDGLQPLRLARDWRQVLALIETAFGENLDAEARRALHSMQPPPLLGPVIGLMDSLAPPGEGMMPGFVWREGGRVVGTASVRRINSYSQGWLISNVAVHPDWQGRGIGRELMEAAVDYARDFGATWVVLQVREDNQAARGLYASMGFQQIGAVVRFRKPTPGQNPPALSVARLRPARWSDGRALASLARSITPNDVLWADNMNRALYRTDPLSRLEGRLKRIHRLWWIRCASPAGSQDEGSANRGRPGIRAAVGIEIDSRTPWHRLRLLILPEARREDLASQLIGFGLYQLAEAPALPVEIEHPASDAATQAALDQAGFEQVFALMHMRLNLK